MDTNATKILEFYALLQPDFPTAEGIEILNPFKDAGAYFLAEQFYHKYYNDHNPRILIFGINPGRFGGGVTGIPFTDPIRLGKDLAIENDLKKVAELSSIFIYETIEAYGGPTQFYSRFLITALSPLGYTRNGVNLNYYDDKDLLVRSEDFVVDCIRKQQKLVNAGDTCFCLGEGTNFKIFTRLNLKHRFFNSIIPLPHPRWIMQYRRKHISEFIQLYLSKLRTAG